MCTHSHMVNLFCKIAKESIFIINAIVMKSRYNVQYENEEGKEWKKINTIEKKCQTI